MRIAIADTNTVVIETLINLLSVIPSYEIIWIARNKNEAIARSRENKPDLLLLDINIQAITEIMKESPCAIFLLLKGTVNQQTSTIFEGMGQGAIDVISLAGIEKSAICLNQLTHKIESIARILGLSSNVPREDTIKTKHKHHRTKAPLLLIGASTGGPAALVKLFKALAPNNPFATVLIQHIDHKFAEGMATWLQEQTSVPVNLLHHDSQPLPGTVFLASQRNHIVFTSNGTLTYSTNPTNQIYTPSIDVLFISAAQNWTGKGFGVLLTGMGDDGARGLRVLRDAGWHTIAQHERSCVVYGMPKVAADLDAAQHILDIDEIVPRLLSLYNETYKHSLNL